MARFTLTLEATRCDCGAITPHQELSAHIADEDANLIQMLEAEGKCKSEISEHGRRITWINTERDSIITTALFDKPIQGHAPAIVEMKSPGQQG